MNKITGFFILFLLIFTTTAALACPPNVINGQAVPMTASECKVWTAAQPSAVQLAAAAAFASAQQGIRIVSTSTPALNGTYPVDAQAQAQVQAEQVSILAQRTFTDGRTSMAWADTSGVLHVFPSTASFAAFAKAHRAYVMQLRQGTVPANPVAIP